MRIKLIVFDLDGVLVDSRDLHYQALNRALSDIDLKYVINYDEHIAKYDGNPTSVKLRMLTEFKQLPIEYYQEIWELKQKYTSDIINKEYKYDQRLRRILSTLKQKEYILTCASNSIYKTVLMMLLRKGLIEYFDYFISNEEVRNPKPNPEIYLKCLERFSCSPCECVVIEDSYIGRKAAKLSGAYLLPVENPKCVTLKRILTYINTINSTKQFFDMTTPYISNNLNIVIPMSGKGSRFTITGKYSFPKPLIEINGKPMIEVVVRNLNLEGQYIYIVQKEHHDKYNLKYLLNLISPNCKIIILDTITEGAACSVLKCKKFINNDTPLIIANSDQFIEWNSNQFIYNALSKGIDGSIPIFESTHPKWSYVALDENNLVTEVAEKKPISTHATVGIYYYKKGNEFVKYAEQMIHKNIKINNEFYVAPIYNEYIQDNKKIKTFKVDAMHSLGTPEDYEFFITNYATQLLKK
jgi:HAD superfamily hydrolase (TIGR01509 family)